MMHCTYAAESISEIVPIEMFPELLRGSRTCGQNKGGAEPQNNLLEWCPRFLTFCSWAQLWVKQNRCTRFEHDGWNWLEPKLLGLWENFHQKNDAAGTSGSPICWWEIFRLTFGSTLVTMACDPAAATAVMRWTAGRCPFPSLWTMVLPGGVSDGERLSWFRVLMVDLWNNLDQVQWMKMNGSETRRLGILNFGDLFGFITWVAVPHPPPRRFRQLWIQACQLFSQGKICHLHPMDWNISMLGLVAEADARAAYLLWVPRVALLWSELVAFCSLMDSGPLLSSLSDDQTCGMVTFNKLWYLSKI